MKPIHWSLIALVLGLAAPAHAVITNVDEASDICAPSEDPCVIIEEVEINPGSVIDFGARDVQLIGGGQLTPGSGSVVFRCGGFTTSVSDSNTAIEARSAAGGGGSFFLEARRTCSGDAAEFCLSDVGCSLGACSAHICSGDPSRTCGGDVDCSVGPCSNGRCAKAFGRLCSVDSDCQLGACETGTTRCSLNLERPCGSDAECDAGTCSVGAGAVLIDGKIRAQGNLNDGSPGIITIFAADDIETRGVINLAGGTGDDDGGLLEIVSGLGSVTIGARVEVTAGRDATGGEVTISAAADVVINAVIDANGGDFDGGTVEIDAGRDILINADILARSMFGEGFGGLLSFAANRDLAIGGGVHIDTSGHQSADGFCGDAGNQAFDALGDMSMAADARLESNGAAPDCAGDVIAINVGGNLTIAGQIESRSVGVDGLGGTVDVLVGGNGEFTPSSSIDVRGGSSGGGSIEVAAGNDLLFDGVADGQAQDPGPAREIKLTAVGAAVIGGSVMIDGTVPAGSTSANVKIDACQITVDGGAVIFNGAINGQNRFTGRESIVTVVGSQITADAQTGLNRFEYRDPTSPPVLGGIITPSPETILNTLLPSCSVCGDGEVDPDEGCDDGDAAWETGQFCSESCSMLQCGDPDNSGSVRATDALIVLTTAVGVTTCDPCVCNVDASIGSIPVTATDALSTLSMAVGLGTELACPPCT